MYDLNINRKYKGVLIGLWIRKQIAKTRIFRVRHGNGFVNSKIGQRYQDNFPYFVPLSINNPQGQLARNALSQAVLNWQTVLTEEQKAEYNNKAKRKHISGYSLYIGEYIKANT